MYPKTVQPVGKPRTSDGKAEKLRGDDVTEVEVLLYDYESGKANVKSAHMAFMLSKVMPLLNKGGSLTVIGMASMFGSEASNKGLSEQRARQVLAFLKQRASTALRVRLLKASVGGTGTDTATKQLQAPGSDNERYRSVYIHAWIKQDPPGLPKLETKLPDGDEFLKNLNGTDIPLPEKGVIEGQGALNIGSKTDAASRVADIGSMVLEAGAVIGGSLAAGVASTALAIVSTVLGLFDSWANAYAPAKFNGKCQGFWDAMQDMADQYKNSSLDKTPLASWPALRKPAPHTGKDPAAFQAEGVWREGQVAGCDGAYNVILGMESNPKDQKVTILGKEEKMTGRIFLRLLSRSKGNQVDQYFFDYINGELKKAGKRPILGTGSIRN
jgi:hypothetical protein